MKLLLSRSPTAAFLILSLIVVFIVDSLTTANFYEHLGVYSNKAYISTKWYSFFTYWIVSGSFISLFWYAIEIILASVIIEHRMVTINFRTLIMSTILLGGILYYIFCNYNPPIIGSGFIVNALRGALIAIWLKARLNFNGWEKLYTIISFLFFCNFIIFEETIFSTMKYIGTAMFLFGFLFVMILGKYNKIGLKEQYDKKVEQRDA